MTFTLSGLRSAPLVVSHRVASHAAPCCIISSDIVPSDSDELIAHTRGLALLSARSLWPHLAHIVVLGEKEDEEVQRSPSR
jgi:hypothetical protein